MLLVILFYQAEKLRPSWQGHSIGHYEGDTRAVDTIGFNDKTFIDGFDTPHTTQLHVIERWHLQMISTEPDADSHRYVLALHRPWG